VLIEHLEQGEVATLRGSTTHAASVRLSDDFTAIGDVWLQAHAGILFNHSGRIPLEPSIHPVRAVSHVGEVL
jgi:hypothetical protein